MATGCFNNTLLNGLKVFFFFFFFCLRMLASVFEHVPPRKNQPQHKFTLCPPAMSAPWCRGQPFTPNVFARNAASEAKYSSLMLSSRPRAAQIFALSPPLSAKAFL
uniref:Uncharacterized protein n=1 Tax=Prorocentrum micans TaxID=2945 RepID=A0A7S2X474_PROMC|mmetsp:Transcript_11687/g.9351  ORF Transcript_11687/g.9351 Transcript_11687/m.9351 type:complete len:106 (+) Transcript_11687:19-336(+)